MLPLNRQFKLVVIYFIYYYCLFIFCYFIFFVIVVFIFLLFLYINHSCRLYYVLAAYDSTCSGDLPDVTNCAALVASPGACFSTDVYERCCESCSDIVTSLYADRTYIPSACQYGDNDEACSTDSINCDTVESYCCYTSVC